MTRLLGETVADWQAAQFPPAEVLSGIHCRLEPLKLGHANELFTAWSQDREHAMWDYLPFGPYDSVAAVAQQISEWLAADDKRFFSIVDGRTNQAAGVAAYLRIQPEAGSIEVGNLAYAPGLQRSRATTEAMYLMMKQAFALGYRRYEWKCNALNEPSKAAAERLGFQFEGVFRQAMVLKGRNRDTAWYSIIDSEWVQIREGLERWLSDKNFDDANQQISKLGAGLWR